MNTFLRRTLVGLALVACPAITEAQILSNLTGGTLLQGSDIGFSVKAVGLTIGANPFAFTSMRALLNSEPFGLIPGSVTGGIYSNVGGNPSTLLSSFNTVNVPTAGQDFIATFTLGSAFTMNAGSTYWFVLRDLANPNGSAAVWRANDVAPVASAGVGFAGYRVSIDGLATWTTSGIMNRVQIEGNVIGSSTVPEPATYAMVLVGLIGIVTARRRRSV
ncbi:MAG: choice-of-anchor R domain-containing protein [Gemmatimonadaceae bacterium]